LGLPQYQSCAEKGGNHFSKEEGKAAFGKNEDAIVQIHLFHKFEAARGTYR
jgi:hypothetical protein